MTGFASLRYPAGAVLLTLALFLASCDNNPPKAQQAMPPPAVTVTAVERTTINPQSEYIGQTVAVDSVDLRARVEAFLERRTFREGEDVKQGALLFALEHDPFAAAVDAAAARVAEAEAEVVRTRRDLERSKKLASQGNLSLQSLDRAQSDQLQAEAALDRSRAELRQAQINLGYTQIDAPFDGRIGRSMYSVGQWVGPDSGVLAQLVKLDPIYVVFNVSERSYLDGLASIEKAHEAGVAKPVFVPRLRLANGSEYPPSGRLDFVDNRVDPTTGTIAVRATFPNPDHVLLPGLFVTVILEESAAKSALLIPQASVQEDQGGRFVIVVGDDNKAEVRRIQTGERIGVRWEVISGLAEGERIVSEGLQKVRAGATVSPSAATPPSSAG
ncbi:MAG: efflux RND transporter periplasmic adaptor subunit [Rhodospirillales bacterium]|nr:efflux RND transporter periplasmic adaptor subunit [Rhodospirillales bacterium]